MFQQDNKQKLRANSKLEGLQMLIVKGLDWPCQTSEMRTKKKSVECLEDN